jgi:hypothetical protein
MAVVLHAHTTTDIAAFIVELTARTPAKDRSPECVAYAVERKFPGVDADQIDVAGALALAMATIRSRQ